MCFCLIAGDGRKSINEKEEKHTHASVPLVCECLPELVTETDGKHNHCSLPGRTKPGAEKTCKSMLKGGRGKQRDVKQAQI